MFEIIHFGFNINLSYQKYSNVPVAGITSLGYDHTNLLGNTIEEIAKQKAGIMKRGSKVYTVEQPIEAMKVLKEIASVKEVLFY